MASELEKIERDVAHDLGYMIHPAGGLTENFVYEPIGFHEYVHRTKAGRKGMAIVQVAN